MIITLLIALILATTVLWMNPRNVQLRWFSIAIYAVCATIIVYELDIHYLQIPNLLINILVFLTDAALAFTICMFGIAYSERFNKKTERKMMLILLFMLVLVMLITPLGPTRGINYDNNNEVPLVIYISFCTISSAFLLIISYIREGHAFKKIERFLTNLLALPIVISVCISYVLYLFDMDLFQQNYVLAIYILMLFLVLGAKRGVLGVKINIEMMRSDATLGAIKGSGEFMNHTLKNEIGKVDILLHQIRQIAAPKNLTLSAIEEISEMASLATDSVHHLQMMLQKVNEKIKEIEVRIERQDLVPLLEHLIRQYEVIYSSDITIKKSLPSEVYVFMDPIHMKEVIMNLISNAIEAMDGKGIIYVIVKQSNRFVTIDIQDSGKGIDSTAISAVFEPFYSTKPNNFGLGLYYCKNVMHKHNGVIDVRSIDGQGACFTLRLNK